MPYCSLEQAMGRKISRRTDIWSYGLTVLEMFNGGLTWRVGASAGQNLAHYLARGPVRPMPEMPEDVVTILRGCFEDDPADRWESMDHVADRLIHVYRRVTGLDYPVPPPEKPVPVESRPKHRERSTDLGGNWIDPVDDYRQALAFTGCSGQGEESELKAQNFATNRARTLHDIEIFEMTEMLYRKNLEQDPENRELRLKLSVTLFNKALALESCQDIRHAVELYRQITNLLSTAETAQARGYRARAALNLAGCLFMTDAVQDAFTTIDDSIGEYRRLLAEKYLTETARFLSIALMNKGVMKNILKQYDESIEFVWQAMEIARELVLRDGADDHWKGLANTLGNLLAGLIQVRRYDEALDVAREVNDIYDAVLGGADNLDGIRRLSLVSLNISWLLRMQRRYPDALSKIEETDRLLRQQIVEFNRDELRLTLAEILAARAEIEYVSGETDRSLQTMAESEAILDQYVIQEGRMQYFVTYAEVCLCSAVMHYTLGDRDTGRRLGAHAAALWLQIIQEKKPDTTELHESLMHAVEGIITGLAHFERPDVSRRFRKMLHTILRKLPGVDADAVDRLLLQRVP